MEVSILQDRVLSIKTQNPKTVTDVIPKSKQISAEEVLVNFGLGEVHILNNMGIKDVPSPMRTQYNYPGMYKPFAHQRTSAEFLTLNRRAFCLNEMGCVDSETEYLSPTGGVKISEYAGGEVAQ